MATARPVGKSRRSTEAAKEDLHVRISETPDVPETSPGEGGRYVYGIVETKEHLNFGKIGIGGGGQGAFWPAYQANAAAGRKNAGATVEPTPGKTRRPANRVLTRIEKYNTHPHECVNAFSRGG